MEVSWRKLRFCQIKVLLSRIIPLFSAQPNRTRRPSLSSSSSSERPTTPYAWPFELINLFLHQSLFPMQFPYPQLFSVHSSSLGFDAIDMTWISAFLIGAGCLALGYIIGTRRSSRALGLSKKSDSNDDGKKKNISRSKPPLEVEKLADIFEDFKMVLVVRNDLKMGKGKIAAQCSHATLGLYKKLSNRAQKSLKRWEMCGQVKVVVKIESEDDMLVLQERAKSLNLPSHITIDAGRTQIAPNSRTVMAILGPADLVDDVTGGLKLL